MLTRLQFDGYIRVGWFLVDAGGEFAIVLPGDIHIEEGNGILFLFAGKLNAFMNGIKAFIEVCCGVYRVIGGAPQARAWVLQHTPTIIHVDEDMAGDGIASSFGFSDGLMHGVNHPDLANCYHK